MWCSKDSISGTVLENFVLAHLPAADEAKARGFLRGGLSDVTYLERIQAKAECIFLILVDLGLQHLIFAVVDAGWVDKDLPIALAEVEKLGLTGERDLALEKEFWHRQFVYLTTALRKGEHLVYDDDELIPLEVVGKSQTYDKVCIPRELDNGSTRKSQARRILLRKMIPLGDEPGQTEQVEFLSFFDQMKTIEHIHIVSMWASYRHRDFGYVLLTPIQEGSLKEIFAVQPLSIKILEGQERRLLFLTWLHCLSHAVSFMHSRNITHGSIEPSNVFYTKDHRVFLSSPVKVLESTVPHVFDKALYDYSAPELRIQAISFPPVFHLPRSVSQTLRAVSSLATMRSQTTTANPANSCSDAASMYTTATISTQSSGCLNSGSKSDDMASDIFSLGCIYLEILSQLLKCSHKAFAAHRTSKPFSTRSAGPPDSSFHRNIVQVHSWIDKLQKLASKQENKCAGVSEILNLVRRMISVDSVYRPTAYEVRNQLSLILTQRTLMKETCCSTSQPVLGLQSTSLKASPYQPMKIEEEAPLQPSISPTSLLETRSRTLSNAHDNASMHSTSRTIASFGTGMTLNRSINGDGRPVKERRYAGGGGRTAGRRPKPHILQRSFSSEVTGSRSDVDQLSIISRRAASSGTIMFATKNIWGSVTGDGKIIQERRYAGGGGRTAKPKEKKVAVSEIQVVDHPDGQYEFEANIQEAEGSNDSMSVKQYGQEKDFDAGSMYELRLYDYENGGEMKKVGWETI